MAVFQTRSVGMMARWVYMLLLVLLCVSGCQSKTDPDLEADAAEIERLSRQVQKAYIARDWEEFAAFFTEDAVWMPPSTSPLVGKEAWWSFVQPWWDQSAVEEMNVSHEEIIVAGDWAFERHQETQLTTSKATGETRQFNFKGVWMLRRQGDGTWRIARYIWNLNPDPDAED